MIDAIHPLDDPHVLQRFRDVEQLVDDVKQLFDSSVANSPAISAMVEGASIQGQVLQQSSAAGQPKEYAWVFVGATTSSYTAGEPTDWSPPPTTIASGLDQLAERLTAEEAEIPGDVFGPGSATDNAFARFDLTTGKLIQNSLVLCSDIGNVSGIVDMSIGGTISRASDATTKIEFNSNEIILASSGHNIASVAGAGSFTVNPDSGAAADFIIKGDTVANLMFADVSQNIISFGGLPSGAFVLVDGKADEVQLRVQGHSTQTNALFLVETSAAVELFSVYNSGNVVVAGTVDGRDIAADGVLLDTAMQALVDDTTPQLGGTLAANSNAIQMDGDFIPIQLGAGQDASIYYDGTNLVIDPQVVGSGYIDANGANLKANVLGLGGNAPASNALVSAASSGSVVKSVISASITYTGTSNTQQGQKFAVSYNGSGTAAVPEAVQGVMQYTSVVGAGNSATAHGVTGQASCLTSQTSATAQINLYGLVGRVDAEVPSFGSHAAGNFVSSSLYCEPPTSPDGTPTSSIELGATINADVLITSNNKLYFEGAAPATGAWTLGDTYMVYDSAGSTLDMFVGGTEVMNSSATELTIPGGIALKHSDYVSVTTIEDSTASAAEFDIFADANYPGTLDYTANVTERGITFTQTNGRFTVDNAGVFVITLTSIMNISSTSTVAMIIKVNGLSVYTHQVNIHSSVDPVERSVQIIKALSASDYVTFHVDSLAAGTVTVQDGTSANIHRIE